MSQELIGHAWWGGRKYRVLCEKLQPNMRDMPSFCQILSEKFSYNEEPADYVGMVLGSWLRKDKQLHEQYRITKKLCEAIAVQVCWCAVCSILCL